MFFVFSFNYLTFLIFQTDPYHKLCGLYIMDALIRRANRLRIKSAQTDVFTPEFAKNLSTTLMSFRLDDFGHWEFKHEVHLIYFYFI
jgi:hypothetical protein